MCVMADDGRFEDDIERTHPNGRPLGGDGDGDAGWAEGGAGPEGPITPPMGTPVAPGPAPGDATTMMPAASGPPVDEPFAPAGAVPPGNVPPAGPGFHPLPEEPDPWYRQRGPVAAVIGSGLALIFLMVAALVWYFSRDDDGDDALRSTDVTTLVTTSSTTTTTFPEPTTTLAVVPDPNATTTTLPDTTLPPPTAAPTTAPPATPAPTTAPPPTAPPSTAPPPTAAPTTPPPPTTTTTTVAPSTTAPPPQVVVPTQDSRVAEIIESSPGLSELATIMRRVNFYDELNAITDPFTYFAPSNEAMRAINFVGADDDAVREVLRRHLTLDGRFTADELFQKSKVSTVQGDDLAIDRQARTVDGAELIVTDKGGANTEQLLHVVDEVLLPNS